MTCKWLGIRKDQMVWQVTEIPKIEWVLPERKGNTGSPGLIWQCLTHGECTSWFLIRLPSSTLQCLFLWCGCWRSSHPILILETRKKKREIKSHIPLPYGYSPGISQILPTFHWPWLRHSHTTLQCDLYFVPLHDQLIFRGSNHWGKRGLILKNT